MMNNLRDITLFELTLLIIDVLFWSFIVSFIIWIFCLFIDLFFKFDLKECFVDIFSFSFINLFLKITINNDPTNIFNIYKKHKINLRN